MPKEGAPGRKEIRALGSDNARKGTDEGSGQEKPARGERG